MRNLKKNAPRKDGPTLVNEILDIKCYKLLDSRHGLHLNHLTKGGDSLCM